MSIIEQELAKLGSRSILRFYVSVFMGVPSVMRGKSETWMFWIGLLALAVVWAKPELAPVIDDPQIVRRVTAVIFVVALAQALLRSNYARFQALQKFATEASSLVRNDVARGAQQTSLGNLRNSYLSVMNSCTAEIANTEELESRMTGIDDWCYAFVSQHFNGGEASLLNASAIQPLDLNAQALARTEPSGKRAHIYLTAQHKAQTLANLIQSRRWQ